MPPASMRLSRPALDVLEAVWHLEGRNQDTDPHEILEHLHPETPPELVLRSIHDWVQPALDELVEREILGWFYYHASSLRGYEILDSEQALAFLRFNGRRSARQGPRQRLSGLAR